MQDITLVKAMCNNENLFDFMIGRFLITISIGTFTEKFISFRENILLYTTCHIYCVTKLGYSLKEYFIASCLPLLDTRPKTANKGQVHWGMHT